MVLFGLGDYMLKKNINGAWSDIETVKRKTSGVWSSCSEVKKKFDGAWSLIWIPTKNIQIYKSDSTNDFTLKEYDGDIMIRNRNYNTYIVRSKKFYLAPYHSISYDYVTYIYTNYGGSLKIGVYVNRTNWSGSLENSITTTSSGATTRGTYSYKNPYNETVEVYLLLRVSYTDFYIENCKLIEMYDETGATAHKLYC